MHRDGENFAEENVVYPGKFFEEPESRLELRPIDPRARELMLRSLLDHTYHPVIHREGFSLTKKVRQLKNRLVLQSLEERIRKSSKTVDIRQRSIEDIDRSFTYKTANYVTQVGKLIVEVYGIDNSEFKDFAKANFHPKETERYKWNVEDHEYRGGKPSERVNWGIALVVNRRWLPEENLARYESAKEFYNCLLASRVFQDSKDHLEFIERAILSNPLFQYLKGEN